MDYFLDEGMPDVIAAVVDDIMIMMIINLSSLVEGKTSLRRLTYSLHYIYIQNDKLLSRRVNLCVVTLLFDAIVKPDSAVLIHFTQRELLLWLQNLVPVLP
jgi:hypothetical protein